VLAGALEVKSASFASGERLTNPDVCDLVGEVQVEEAQKGDLAGNPWASGNRNDYSWRC
jgi:hypothetical protein